MPHLHRLQAKAATPLEGRLLPVLIEALHPTQITVGFREVAEKRRRYRNAVAGGRLNRFPRRPTPIVLGPGGQAFVLDGHHWLRALSEEGVREVLACVVDDLSGGDGDGFWPVLDSRGWCHPFDADGRRQGYDAIPETVELLGDDPFRSLASALRRDGGFAKDDTLFSEFHWADHLRRHVDPSLVEQDFDRALAAALELARHFTPASQIGGQGPRAVSHVQVM
jgi:hypothetical protein